MHPSLRLLTCAAAALALQACAGMSTMEKRTIDNTAYPSQIYKAPKTEVVKATTETISVLGYSLKKVTEGTPTTQVYFSKPMSAFSWGEVGRIDVESVDATTTRVILATEKRYQIQVTGTKQSEFATQIFTEMKSRLN